MKGLALLCVLSVAAVAPVQPRVAAVAFSPTGRKLAAARRNEVLLLEVASGKQVGRMNAGEIVLNSIVFTPDGKFLIGAGGLAARHGEIQVWEIATQRRLYRRRAHKDAILSVALSPDGARLAAGSYDKTVSLWSRNPQSEFGNPQSLIDHTEAVYAVAFSPDGLRLASASGDRTVKVWDAHSGRRHFTLSEATAELYNLAWSPNGTQITAGGVDKLLRVWNVTAGGGALARSAFAHDGALLRTLFTRNGAGLLTCGEDRLVKFWESATLHETHVLPRLNDWPHALALSPEGKFVAVGSHDGSVMMFDAARLQKRWLWPAGRR